MNSNNASQIDCKSKQILIQNSKSKKTRSLSELIFIDQCKKFYGPLAWLFQVTIPKIATIENPGVDYSLIDDSRHESFSYSTRTHPFIRTKDSPSIINWLHLQLFTRNSKLGIRRSIKVTRWLAYVGEGHQEFRNFNW